MTSWLCGDPDAHLGRLETLRRLRLRAMWRPGALCRQCGQPMRGTRMDRLTWLLVCDRCDGDVNLR